MKHEDRKIKNISEPAAPSADKFKSHIQTHTQTTKTPPGAAHPSLNRHCCHVLKNNILDFTGGRDRNRLMDRRGGQEQIYSIKCEVKCGKMVLKPLSLAVTSK